MLPPLTYSHDGLTLPPLVSLTDMKAHLHITDVAHDAQVTAANAAAQQRIIEHLSRSVVPTWTDTTAPATVTASIKLVAAHLYQYRGDDADPQASGKQSWEKVWAQVCDLLGTRRDLTVA